MLRKKRRVSNGREDESLRKKIEKEKKEKIEWNGKSSQQEERKEDRKT